MTLNETFYYAKIFLKEDSFLDNRQRWHYKIDTCLFMLPYIWSLFCFKAVQMVTMDTTASINAALTVEFPDFVT